MGGQDTTLHRSDGGFPSTLWTVVRNAGRNHPQRRQNLEQLIRLYWRPVYHYIRRAWNRGNEDAKDLTQAFFTMLIERDDLAGLSPELGRFRHFLRAALRHFILKEDQYRARQKRGGSAVTFALDVGDDEIKLADRSAASPSEVFDQEWRRALLAHASEKLRGELSEIQFRVFERYHLSTDPEPPPYDAVAKDLGVSRFDVGNHLKAARKRLREIILEEIEQYVDSPQEARQELEELFGL